MDKTALYKLSYGLYAIGALDGKRPCGCIVNTVFQLTSEPPCIALSLNKSNFTEELVKRNGRFSVSVLSERTAPIAITYLGFQSGRERDKYEQLEYEFTQSGLPVLNDNICATMECSVINTVDAGTHTLIVAEVVDAQVKCDAPPMTYAYYHSVIKGSAPKNAPTYRAE